MTRLRHALGDSSDAPSFIETLPRIGYRFIHAIERDDVEPGSVALVEPHADSSRRTWAAVASALLIGVLGTAVWRPGPDDQTIEFAETPGSLQTHNPDAREAYLRGLDFFEQRNKEAIERSIVQLTRAMEAAVTMLRHPVVAKSLPPLRYRSSLR